MGGAAFLLLLLLLSAGPAGGDGPVRPPVGRGTERFEEAKERARQGDVERALHLLDEELDEHPANREALELAGYLYYSALYFDRAAACFLRALEADPESAYSLLMLGNVAYRTFRYARALHYYRRAGRLDPSNTLLARNIRLSEAGIARTRRAADCRRRVSILFWCSTLGGCFLLFLVLLRELRR